MDNKDNKDKKDKKYKILRKQVNWNNLWFYRKALTVFQLTTVFTKRFLPLHGDRTVDQMVQAARSGKQNIVEGSADGVTATIFSATNSHYGIQDITASRACWSFAVSTTMLKIMSPISTPGAMRKWQISVTHCAA